MAEGTNQMSIKTIYQSFGGQSVGMRGSAASAATSALPKDSSKAAKSTTEAEAAAAVGASGSPLVWLGVLALMLFGLMFLAQRFGTEGAQFARIRMSFYNVLVISLAAVIGINIYKALFTKFKVPGLSSVFLAA